jgi:hypothetical protein
MYFPDRGAIVEFTHYYGTDDCTEGVTVKAIFYSTYLAQFRHRHSWWYNIPDVFIISQMII